MQVANGGGVSSDSPAGDVGVVGNGNDELSDLSTNSNVVQANQTQIQAQQQQQQQQRQTSTSPGQQHSQHHHHHASHNPAVVTGLGSNSNQTGSSGGVHHHHVSQSGGGGYHHHQRHAQSYHQNHQQQHHHMQHYHHHHQNKYNHNNPRGGDGESNVNHVLLITVMNPHYTINCDLIHQICSTYGKVNRIVIFKKNGVQAMVEFDNVESAKRAKSTLNGCDVYSGCCTLKIEFAKPTRLNIHKNDNDSFDYTNPNLGSGGQPHTPQQQQPDSDGVINETGMGEQIQPSSHPQSIHHPMQQHSPHGHHQRGGGTRGGSGVPSGGGHNQNDGHHHFHAAHQHSQSNNPQHHVQSAVPSHVTVTAAQHGSASGYGIASSLDQSNDSADTFNQDGGFNVARAGDPPGPAAYVDADSYLPPHEGHPAAHGGLQHGNMYSRHDGQHHHQQQQHHHHHHHTRPGGPNHNNLFPPGSASNSLMSGPSNLGQPQGAVMMVYGLQPERVNCDRLFNLFCLYGNVVRVSIKHFI